MISMIPISVITIIIITLTTLMAQVGFKEHEPLNIWKCQV